MTIKLKDLFEKDVLRPIQGVVNAHDGANLALEVEEYVLTNEAEKEVRKLLEDYTSSTTANGVWISGFFGSGKSHLLKMLAHLLGDVEGQAFARPDVSEAFASKTDDKFLAGLLTKSDKISGKSLLFNIDHLADAASKDLENALLRVFVKVFDDSCGYYGTQGHVAKFERTLDKAGQYDDFKNAYASVTGKAWVDDRKNYIIQGKKIDQAYAQVVSGEAPTDILKTFSADYTLSVDSFADEVVEWLSHQDKDFRLNFFVDEVGQFIGSDSKRMLNLQSIAEQLNGKAKGRAWVFVTSQEDLDKVSEMNATQGADFSKIMGRFATRVKLTSTDVEEVIRKRLLAKDANGEYELKKLHALQEANFKTLFDFPDGAKLYKNYATEALFVGTYPFVSYQFPLFQAAIEGLSKHDALEGKNTAVGERSIIVVVQEVAKSLTERDLGDLASFDLMFEGIRSMLKSANQKSILLAEQHLDSPLAIRLLKALLLVKYVEGFQATERNLTVLVYDRFGQDHAALQKGVKDALALLEQQTYVQRTGDTYAYLTNDEQDIEKEIKNLSIDSGDVNKKIFEILTNKVYTPKKYRYPKNQQDFEFGYRLDDAQVGHQKELALHFITPGYQGDLDAVRMQGAGLSELRVALEADPHLLSDVAFLIKTDKYIKQKAGSLTPAQESILRTKQSQNALLEKELGERAKTSAGAARLFVNANEVTSSSTVADTRIGEGMAALVGFAYPQLSILNGKTFPLDDVAKYLTDDQQTLPVASVDLSAPATEVFSMGIVQKEQVGAQVTVKSILDLFRAKPYGWDDGSILCLVAHLFGQSKITVEKDNTLLKKSEIASSIRNNQLQGQLVVRKQAAYDPAQVKVFADFVKEFFDEPNLPKDPTELARVGKEKLAAYASEFKGYVKPTQYPFTSALDEPLNQLAELLAHDEPWFITQFSGGDELLDAKDSVLLPIGQFFKGQQVGIYDSSREFLTANAANLNSLPTGCDSKAKDLIADPGVFRGNKVNVLKVEIDELRTQIDARLAEERGKAQTKVLDRKKDLEASGHFIAATAQAQQHALTAISAVLSGIASETSIAQVQLSAQIFATQTYPRLLEALVKAKNVPPAEPGEGTGVEGEPDPAPAVQFIHIDKIAVDGKHELATSDDVEEYVAALRDALNAAVSDGKRITR